MMKVKRVSITYVLLIVFLFLAFMLIGCEQPDEVSDDNGEELDEHVEKVLRVAITREPDGFDHHATRDVNTGLITVQWTEQCWHMDPFGNRIGHDGEGILKQEQVGETTYEYTFRDDLTFHNGDPFTIEDAKFSFERVMLEGGMEGETSPMRRSPYTTAESVEIVGDWTLRVEYEDPDIAKHLSHHPSMYPKNLFEELGPDKFFENPIGIGPFKWVEGDPAEFIILERFEDYYGGIPEAVPGEPERVPPVDRLEIYFIPEAISRIAALIAGDVDVIQDVPVDQVPLLDNNPDIQVDAIDGTRINAIEFNVNKPPFDDVRVRHAVAYAIDYELITDVLYGGYSTPLYGRPYIEPY